MTLFRAPTTPNPTRPKPHGASHPSLAPTTNPDRHFQAINRWIQAKSDTRQVSGLESSVRHRETSSCSPSLRPAASRASAVSRAVARCDVPNDAPYRTALALCLEVGLNSIKGDTTRKMSSRTAWPGWRIPVSIRTEPSVRISAIPRDIRPERAELSSRRAIGGE